MPRFHDGQDHRFSLCRKLLRDFIRDEPSGAGPPDQVRAVGLHRTNLLDIMGRHVFHPHERPFLPVQSTRLQAIERLLLSQQGRQTGEDQDVSPDARNGKKRPVWS